MTNKLDYFRSISQIFDKDNEWVGYEYVVNVDENHSVIESYDSSGRLLSLKHQFNNPLNNGTTEDFISYMKKIKSTSFNWNSNYIDEISREPIDIKSSIQEAKSINQLKKK
ncbi:hypothetical protein G6698_04320 [Polynucleobacter paneuropaeus]|nr:hypothetical protein [Polynucleobacter paneuropaeus]MBT8576479.1 hypothetical protein [Polynucleobacter paneuropaeus]